VTENDDRRIHRGDSLRASTAPEGATVIDNSHGAYPTESWEATYFNVSQVGALTAHRILVRVPAGLGRACPPVPIGQPGCVYAVRRWGFALRPSALAAAGFDSAPLLSQGTDADVLRLWFGASAFDLPGQFIIASPEHPFRLVGPDGALRGSSMQWRTYLGALAFFTSGGRIDADFIRFWAEAEASYQQAVSLCLAALQTYEAPFGETADAGDAKEGRA
jgi:hypothetical protein